MRSRFSILSIVVFLSLTCSAFAQGMTENVILITLDGARTQEVFGGLDLEILKDKTRRGKVEDSPLYKKFWAETAEERRMRLLPFFWGVLMKEHGSIAGNRALGSAVMTTNRMWFSYPGYSEILTGQARDDVINSNDRIRNPNPTVLEFLKRKLELDKNQVALFGSWDVFNWIGEREEGSITINAGHEPYDHPSPEIRVMSELQNEKLSPWDSVRFDYFTFRFAMEHLKTYQPRVMHIALGETDDWAHGGDYSHTISSFHKNDRQLKELWEYLESSPKYRGKTSIIITIDHGRGKTIRDWTDHGEKVPEAQYIWMAFISPDSQLRGEWRNAETIYQNQVAATLCRFLNLDYSENNPKAGKPITRLFRGK
ncbi:MAG: phosphoglyceromutase [Acidobacteriota bacterium]|nr:MAG: phosphoglyceromutase [Acidobacteriota bacterium]